MQYRISPSPSRAVCLSTLEKKSAMPNYAIGSRKVVEDSDDEDIPIPKRTPKRQPKKTQYALFTITYEIRTIVKANKRFAYQEAPRT